MSVEHWLAWLPDFATGTLISVQVTLSALALGIPLGAVFAFGVMSSNRLLRYLTLAIVELGRGTPVLIVLYFIYYGLPSLHMVTTSFTAAVLGLGFTTGAYTSEIFRSGIQAVPGGEHEAGLALGLSRRRVMLDIVLPQGVRLAVPALFGFSITVFQASALTFAISLPELLSRAYSAGSQTFDYLGALALAGAIYLVITLPSSFLVQRFEAQPTFEKLPRSANRRVGNQHPSIASKSQNRSPLTKE